MTRTPSYNIHRVDRKTGRYAEIVNAYRDVGEAVLYATRRFVEAEGCDHFVVSNGLVTQFDTRED